MMSDKLCSQCGLRLEDDLPCPACMLEFVAETDDFTASATLPDLEIELVRQTFPQLEIVEMVGRGGMGTVFKARQPNLDRFVALKILPENRAKHPSFAERFAREGKLLARLSHPNIVAVYDFGQTEIAVPDAGGPVTFFYLIMEFVDGVDLRHAMREERFSPEQALAIVPKICDALQYAHEEGVLHRDIKPENILLDVKGRIKIADFGIASVRTSADDGLPTSTDTNPQLTQTGQIIGTPNYMAPEQFEGATLADARADIYSLGVVFYELLTGELPKGDYPKPSEKSSAGSEIDHIVQKALDKNRESRYQSAEEFKTDVYHTVYVLNSRKNETQTPDGVNPFRSFYARLLFALVGICTSVFVFHIMSTIRTDMTFRPNASAAYMFSLPFSLFVTLLATFASTVAVILLMRYLGKKRREKTEAKISTLDNRRRLAMLVGIVVAAVAIITIILAVNGPPTEAEISYMDNRRRAAMFWILTIIGSVIIAFLVAIWRRKK